MNETTKKLVYHPGTTLEIEEVPVPGTCKQCTGIFNCFNKKFSSSALASGSSFHNDNKLLNWSVVSFVVNHASLYQSVQEGNKESDLRVR